MYLKVLMFLFIIFAFSACEEDNPSKTISDPGEHFQNMDCLLCHNSELTSDVHLSYGGTLYLDAISETDDLSKTCKETVYLQFENSGTIAYDSRALVKSTDSGTLGRGNLFLKQSTATVPTGSYNMRLILADGTLLARSGLHDFSGTYATSNSGDSNNRYSCNACHSTTPTGGANGLMVVDQNLSFCLTKSSDVPVATYFTADTFPLLETKCGSCHNIGQVGATLSQFDLDSTNIPQTRTDLLTFVVNTVNPSLSTLVNCPVDSNHTGLGICSKSGNDYARVIEWINLE